jgi:hypothetical protein
MEPIMSCPQGLTLSGKMCTVAPTLSCPSGYNLVNGMCQQDDGLQGYGDSMNIPPSDNRVLASGDVISQQEQARPPMMMSQSPTPNPTQQQYGESIMSLLPNLPGQQAFMGAAAGVTGMGMSPVAYRAPDRPISNIPQIQTLGSPMMPSRPLSPQRRQQRMMSPLPPPPPMGSPKPPPIMPSSSPVAGGQPCPMGYSLNRSDGMCYPL